MAIDPEAELRHRPPPDERTSRAVIAVETFLDPRADPQILELHATTEHDGELWSARLDGTDIHVDGYLTRTDALHAALARHLRRNDNRATTDT